MTLLHTLPKIISLETQWCLSLMGYLCQIVREGWRKRLKTEPFVPTTTLFFFNRGILSENDGKVQPKFFQCPTFYASIFFRIRHKIATVVLERRVAKDSKYPFIYFFPKKIENICSYNQSVNLAIITRSSGVEK